MGSEKNKKTNKQLLMCDVYTLYRLQRVYVSGRQGGNAKKKIMKWKLWQAATLLLVPVSLYFSVQCINKHIFISQSSEFINNEAVYANIIYL